jgi:hypothetical protein
LVEEVWRFTSRKREVNVHLHVAFLIVGLWASNGKHKQNNSGGEFRD